MKLKLNNDVVKKRDQIYLVGLDIGTSSTKISVIDLNGNCVYSNSKSYEIEYLPNDWVQQNPEVWYASVSCLLKEIPKRKNIDVGKIGAIGISSQSNALVSLDENGRLLYPAILYLDKRTASIYNSFRNTIYEKNIFKIGGNLLRPSYTGLQILWMKKNEPAIYNKTYKFLTANGYIIYKLTGKFSHDYTQTGMTSIFDMKKGIWSEELLSYFDIKRDKLADVYRPYEIVGKTGREFENDTNIPAGIPVVAGAMDAASAMLGSGCIEIGSCLIEMGSVINIIVLSDRIRRDKNLQTYPGVVPESFIIAGSVDGAGNTLTWFIDNIYKGFGCSNKNIPDKKIYEILGDEIKTTRIGSGNIIFLPFMAGMRTPRSDLNTKGAFLGTKISTKKIDIFRSILEGCSYGLRYNLEFILKKGIDLGPVIASGGGSKDKFWLQMISDVLNINIKRSSYNSGASMGSAMLAGIGIGAFRDFNHAKRTVCKYDYDFISCKESSIEYEKYYKHYNIFLKDIMLDLHLLEEI